MKSVYAVLAILGLAVSLMGMSHGGGIDHQKYAAGFNGFGDAMNAGNLDALVAGFTEDAVRIHPLAGEVKGHDGQRAFLQSLIDGFRDQKLVVNRAGGHGNTVYIEWTWTAVHKESGKAVTLDELVWVEVAKDGRIQRMRQYFDTAAFLKQLE